jgi:hypothetical protein
MNRVMDLTPTINDKSSNEILPDSDNPTARIYLDFQVKRKPLI